MVISADFNQVSLSATLTTFQQFVYCSSGENKKFDLFYESVKDASLPVPH